MLLKHLIISAVFFLSTVASQASQAELQNTVHATHLLSGDISIKKNINGTLFFYADDGIHSKGLWQSDGSITGTKIARDIMPNLGSPPPLLHRR